MMSPHRLWQRARQRWRRWNVDQYEAVRGLPLELAVVLVDNAQRAIDQNPPRALLWWRRIVWCGYGVAVIWLLLYRLGPLAPTHSSVSSHLNLLLHVAGFAAVLWWDRQVKQRVQRLVDAELKRERLSSCLRCGYDQRGTTGDACPECGASLRVGDWLDAAAPPKTRDVP